MPHSDDALQTLEGLATSFGIDTEASLIDATLRMEDVKAFLIPRIAQMLNRNPARLMSILYRVDVAEAKVQEILRDVAPEHIPAALADVLIERQLLKLQIRRRYAAQRDAT